jgi:hypothetical protein
MRESRSQAPRSGLAPAKSHLQLLSSPYLKPSKLSIGRARYARDVQAAPLRRSGRRNVSGSAYRGVMSAAPVVRMDVLWPELAGQRRAFEVMVTVPRGDGGEPLVPRALPPEALGWWSADRVAASVTVLAARPSGAVVAAEALVHDLARSAGVVVTARAARPSVTASSA